MMAEDELDEFGDQPEYRAPVLPGPGAVRKTPEEWLAEARAALDSAGQRHPLPSGSRLLDPDPEPVAVEVPPVAVMATSVKTGDWVWIDSRDAWELVSEAVVDNGRLYLRFDDGTGQVETVTFTLMDQVYVTRGQA